MTVDLGAVLTEEDTKNLENIVNGDGSSSITYLDDLRQNSLPIINSIVSQLDKEYRLFSEVSCKKAETAIDKCKRPATLDKYPWFNISHIRDYLRFRTYIQKTSDFINVLEKFIKLQEDNVVSIVKIDCEKLIRPGVFGWRMIAVDLRIVETGMLVEHYMTFEELIEVNEKWLHKVYEAWRSQQTDDMTMEQLRNLNRDSKFSRHAYRELLFDGILREQSTKSLTKRRFDTGEAILKSLNSILNLP